MEERGISSTGVGRGRLTGLRASIAALPVLLLLAISVPACQENPATGEKQFGLLSVAEQRQLGAEADAQIVAQFGVYDDPELQAWVESIGENLLQYSNDTRFDYTFRILDTEVINAFALPGGYIYVTRGLMAYLNNEAQLAVVLGHEIGHVAANHAVEQYTNNVLASIGLAVGGAVFEDLGPLFGAAQTGLQLLFLKYGRDDESQSDTLGVMYATRAGYEAAEGAEFFVTLNRLQEQAGASIPSWASTHPDPVDRQGKIIQKAAEWKAVVGTELGGDDPAGYIPRLDDMIFGQNPRNGFVQGGVFYHPDLRIRFDVPSNWSVGNYATQVQMVDPNGQAAIIFTLAEGSSAATAASQMQSSQGVQTVNRTNTSVNGFPAVRLRSNIPVEGGTLAVLSYFIEKDQRVYVFHGYTASNLYGGYESAFIATATSFAEVTNSSILNVQPFRLNAFQAASTASFSSLIQQNVAAGMDLMSLAILNQVETGTTIEQGAWLKGVD